MRKLLLLLTIGLLYTAPTHAQNAAASFTKAFNQGLQNGANAAAMRSARLAADAARGWDLLSERYVDIKDAENTQKLDLRGSIIDLEGWATFDDYVSLFTDEDGTQHLLVSHETGAYQFIVKAFKDKLSLDLEWFNYDLDAEDNQLYYGKKAMLRSSYKNMDDVIRFIANNLK